MAEKQKQEETKTDTAKQEKKDGQAQSNVVDQYNESKMKEHPERVVDGKYYEDDKALEEAKKAYEKKKEEALKQARIEVKEKEEKRQEAANRINEALYGPGNDVTADQMRMTVGGIEMDAILGNAELVQQRQHLLDPTDYEEDVKKPNPGKFPNNKDPYPVDLKIEELEAHKPDVKIHQVTTHIHAEAAAAAAMICSDTAEKRLIHLENITATLMRYIFRLGSRVHINCQYWGGTTPFQKYRTIRCMHDDRISDGELVQIDQCMNCTRYEPVYGQCYEIMNNLGANVAAILDDNQMGYADMDDYVDLARTERFIKAKKRGEYDLSEVLTRAADDVGFEEVWGEGIKMNWQPVAKEDQKCHINWRQSINDDGSNLQRLASFPKDEIESGSILTAATNSSQSIIDKEYQAMQSNSREDLKGLLQTATQSAQNADEAISAIKSGIIDQARQAVGSQSIDTLVVACIHFLTKMDIAEVVTKYADMLGGLGVKNVGLIVSGIACGNNAIRGEGDKIHKIEEVGKCAASSSGSDNSNSSSASSHYDASAKDLPKLDASNMENWLWVDYAPALIYNAKENGKNEDDATLFARVVYLYKSLEKYIRGSRYDTADYAFPYTEEDLKSCDGVEYSGAYGEPRSDHIHRGVDLATGAGNFVPIHAIHSGTVTAAGDGWGSACNAVNIAHGDGTYARYLHCSEVKVQKGQQVNKGDIIALTGGTGANGPDTYPVHLHLEFGHGDNPEADVISDTNALTLFNEVSTAAVHQTFKWDGIA